MRAAVIALCLGTAVILAALTGILALGMIDRGDLRGWPALGIVCLILAAVAWAWRLDYE